MIEFLMAEQGWTLNYFHRANLQLNLIERRLVKTKKLSRTN